MDISLLRRSSSCRRNPQLQSPQRRNLDRDKVDATAGTDPRRGPLQSRGTTPRGVGACRDLSMPDFISKFDLIAGPVVACASGPLIIPSIYKSLIFRIRATRRPHHTTAAAAATMRLGRPRAPDRCSRKVPLLQTVFHLTRP